MLYLKACPRCGGDLTDSRLEPGEHICLQCGYIAYPTPPLPFVAERGSVVRGRQPKTKRAA